MLFLFVWWYVYITEKIKAHLIFGIDCKLLSSDCALSFDK